MTKLALLLLSFLPQDRPPTPWHTTRLENGVLVHAVTIPDATAFAAFSFLPIGLDGDPPGRAQFAHLAEHMLIRSTDPRRLQVGELQLNGETTNQVMRLESFAPPADQKDALLRHARWLTARKFDAATLAREKVRIAGEEQTTVPRGFNHKWATAAWAQLAGGGSHAAVHGDVAGATVEQIERFVADRVRLRDAQVFLAGPGPAADLVAALRAEFVRIAQADQGSGTTQRPTTPGPGTGPAGATAPDPARKPVRKPAQEPAQKPAEKPAHREVTWDLDAAHYLEWYALPADCTAVESEVLAQVLTAACFRSPAFRDVPGRALAGSVRRGGTRYVILSTHLPDGAEVPDVAAAFAKAIRQAPAVARFQARGDALADRFATLPDFAAQRRQIENPRFRKLIEANWAMQCGYAAARLGVSVQEVPQRYRALRTDRILALLETRLRPAARHSVRITPRR